jgi:hypothetical protein
MAPTTTQLAAAKRGKDKSMTKAQINAWFLDRQDALSGRRYYQRNLPEMLIAYRSAKRLVKAYKKKNKGGVKGAVKALFDLPYGMWRRLENVARTPALPGVGTGWAAHHRWHQPG